MPLCRVCSPVYTLSLRIFHFLDQRACLKLSASATRSHSHPVFTAPLNEGQGIHSTSLGTVQDSKPPLRHIAACLAVPGLVSPRRVVCLARLQGSASSCRGGRRESSKQGIASRAATTAQLLVSSCCQHRGAPCRSIPLSILFADLLPYIHPCHSSPLFAHLTVL